MTTPRTIAAGLLLTGCHDALASDGGSTSVADGSSSSGSGGDTDATSEPTGGPTTAGSMSASGSETEGSSSTTSGGGCEMSAECIDPANPICVDEACVPCTDDAECLAKGPGAPVCSDEGRCVACTPSNAGACEGVTPICNAVNECEGCDFHEQCAGTACDIATGACFAADCVVEVDGDGGADYQNIQAALVDGCVVLVHELDGVGVPYIGALSVDGIKVAILAADGEEPIVQGTGGNPSLSLTNDATVYVQGLTFSQNTVEGIRADGATLYLDRAQVVGNTGGGILLENAASSHLRNCFVRGADGFAAVTSDGSTVDILYSTLVGVLDTSPALTCDAGVVARNSIIVSRATGGDPDIACPAAITYSALELDYPGEGNVELGALTSGNQDTWFTSYMAGDFHLVNPPANLLTAALWQAGDPLVDIEGAARPSEVGTADVAGADLP
jgi:hypothetical protein